MNTNEIPKSEQVWETIQYPGVTYYVTSKAARDFYFLYKESDGVLTKLGKDKDPLNLRRKYLDVKEKQSK